MRIANVIEESKLGGPQVRMVRVAAALGKRAETLIVMPRANSGPFREICETHSFPYSALPLTRITKEWRAALSYVLFSPIGVLRLARLFRHERIDLVHALGGSWQYKAVIAAWLAGIPSVWHLNDTGRRLRMGAAARGAANAFKPEEAARLTLGTYERAVYPGRLEARAFSDGPEIHRE